VRETGLEPARCCHRQPLKPMFIPIMRTAIAGSPKKTTKLLKSHYFLCGALHSRKFVSNSGCGVNEGNRNIFMVEP